MPIRDPCKRFQHLPNIRSTKVEHSVGQMLDKRSVQTVSTPFNILKNKENVESMLNESLNQFNLIQQAFNNFYAFNNVERPVQTPPTFVLVMRREENRSTRRETSQSKDENQ